MPTFALSLILREIPTMKFAVSSGTLLKALQAVQGIVPANAVFPILDHFLLRVDEGRLHITTSDNHASMSTSTPVEGDADGSFCAPARILTDTLKTLPEQPITISYDAEDHAMKVAANEGIYYVVGQDAKEFPTLPTVGDGANQTALPASALQRGLESTLFAVGNDDLRLAMTGVYFVMEPGQIILVATDAHKLVRYQRKDVPSAVTGSFIVPRKELMLLKNALPKDAASEVRIDFTNSHARFTINDLSLVTRLIDQRYPDYNAVIPKDNPNRLIVNRMDLEASLRRAIIYASKTTSMVRLKLSGSNLNVVAEDTDFNHKAEQAIACNYTGEAMEIGFNARFLMDMLGTLTSEEAVIDLSQPSKPGIVTPGASMPDEEVLMLIMPVMLNNYEYA